MLLEVEGVSKAFGGLMALTDVNLTVEAGETVGIMGANGAGKTTLFSLIAGNDRPTRGRIRLDGERIDGRRPDQISRRGVARTYQIVRPFAGMTVAENVAIGCLFGTRREPSRRRALEQARAILDEVGLAARADHMAGDLTVAGLKRLEVARALAAGPRLLMLDEVMAGLTPNEVAEALAMLGGLKQRYGLTLLVVEHVMRALMQMCGRILVLHHGVTIATGTPDEIGANPAVIDAYLGKEA
jgi:branched-chain amino acid transport system ATP-binding protein